MGKALSGELSCPCLNFMVVYFGFQVTAYFKKFPFQLPQSGVGVMDGVDEGKHRVELKLLD